MTGPTSQEKLRCYPSHLFFQYTLSSSGKNCPPFNIFCSMIMAETTGSSVIQMHQDSYSPPKWSYIADMEWIASSFCTNIYPCCRAQRKCLRYRPCGLVYINTTGCTCLHELSIEYEQVTAWVARFSSNKLEANFYQPSSTLDGSMDMRINRCHYSLVNFKQPVGRNHGGVADTAHTGSFITRRSHLNLLWIYIMLSTPMIYTFCYGQVRRISRQLLESS